MLAALAAATLLLLAVLLLVVRVRTDMADFLPQGQTEAARLVMREARSGAATGLILLGIEGAPPAELARISRTMAAALPETGLFALVLGAGDSLPEAQGEALFARRYLLSPASTEVAFTEPALRRALEALLRQLGSSMGPLAVQFGLADPPGAFLAMLRNWAGSNPVRLVEGSWFAAETDRALLLVRTRAGGMDIPAQEAATAAIEPRTSWRPMTIVSAVPRNGCVSPEANAGNAMPPIASRTNHACALRVRSSRKMSRYESPEATTTAIPKNAVASFHVRMARNASAP